MSNQHTQAIKLNGALFVPDYIEWNGLLYAPLKECTYEPSVFETEWDEQDQELKIGRPSDDCDSFVCSECGNELAFDWGGDRSWFDPKPPYKPIGLKHCPGCGSRVLFPPSWIGKRTVVG